MKKLTASDKLALQQHAERSFWHDKKRANKKRKLAPFMEKQNSKERRNKRFHQNIRKTKHTTCSAPVNFSLIENASVVQTYFEEVESSFKKDVSVVFNLSNVKNMDIATLTYLCANLNSPHFLRNNAFEGNTPDEEKLKELFFHSGFYDYVLAKNSPYKKNKGRHGELTHNRLQRVESEIAGRICDSAIEHIFPNVPQSEAMTCVKDLYRVLIECMANTWNHSNYGKNQRYDWWLMMYKEKTSKTVKFCFLDLGIGVFASLNKKYLDNMLSAFLRNLFVPDDNVATLKKIFAGAARSSTELPERGRGINCIYQTVKNSNCFMNFHILSNDVLAKIEYNTPDNVRKMNKQIPCTVYYWEMKNANIN